MISDYINNQTPIEYICIKHPEIIQKITYGNLLKRNPCKICNKENFIHPTKKEFEDVQEAFLNRGYILLEHEYISAHYKMKYICPKHPDIIQYMTWNNLKKGEGCPLCARQIRGDKKRYPLSKLQEEFKSRNYILLTKDRKHHYDKLEYLCMNHLKEGIQTISLGNFHAGQGCSFCNRSRGETKIAQYLKQNKIYYESEKCFKDNYSLPKGRFDFWLPTYNLLIEYDGIQHYKPVCFGNISKERALHNLEKTQSNDKLKTLYCIETNKRLLRIPYWDFNHIEDILKKELNIY